MKKLSVVVCTFVWILRGIIFIVITVIHIHISHWRRDDRSQVCIAYSVTIYVSGFGKCGSLVIVCIFAWKILCIASSVIIYFIISTSFGYWSSKCYDFICTDGHMQNLNFLQFRYFVIYFVIFVSTMYGLRN